MAGGSVRLSALRRRTDERSRALLHVRAALPPKLAQAVASAGIENGLLSIGVMGATWASRLRYTTETLRKKVGEAMGTEVTGVRVKVVPPPGSTEPPEP